MYTTTTSDTMTVDWSTVTTTYTPSGDPIRPIGNQSAIDFGLDHPHIHRARMRLGIAWRTFRRAWNHVSKGATDKRRTRAFWRVMRSAGRCVFREEWQGMRCTLRCIRET